MLRPIFATLLHYYNPDLPMTLQSISLKLRALLFSALLLAAFTACNNDDDGSDPDTEKPVISLVSPALESEIGAGQTLQLEIAVTDNQDLSSLRINIHNNFDGHDHNKKSAEPFTFNETIEVSGTEEVVTRSIEIPADAAAGPYHLMAYCLDAQGNEADFVEAELTITSSSQPVIEDVEINGSTDLSSEIHVHFDGADAATMTLKAHIDDSDGDLKKIKVEIKPEDHQHKTSDGDHAAFEWETEEVDAAHHHLEETFTLNKANFHLDEHDHFMLRIVAEDAAGNHTVVTAELHVE